MPRERKRKANPFARLCYRVRDKYYPNMSVAPHAVRIIGNRFNEFLHPVEYELTLERLFKPSDRGLITKDNVDFYLDRLVLRHWTSPPSPARTIGWGELEELVERNEISFE
jgi:hypothetical protein